MRGAAHLQRWGGGQWILAKVVASQRCEIRVKNARGRAGNAACPPSALGYITEEERCT